MLEQKAVAVKRKYLYIIILKKSNAYKVDI